MIIFYGLVQSLRLGAIEASIKTSWYFYLPRAPVAAPPLPVSLPSPFGTLTSPSSPTLPLIQPYFLSTLCNLPHLPFFPLLPHPPVLTSVASQSVLPLAECGSTVAPPLHFSLFLNRPTPPHPSPYLPLIFNHGRNSRNHSPAYITICHDVRNTHYLVKSNASSGSLVPLPYFLAVIIPNPTLSPRTYSPNSTPPRDTATSRTKSHSPCSYSSSTSKYHFPNAFLHGFEVTTAHTTLFASLFPHSPLFFRSS